MLRAVFTNDVAPNFETELDKSTKNIREARQKKGGTNTVLIAQGYGETLISMDSSKEKGDYIVVLEGVDKETIKLLPKKNWRA
jgi:hypothetical protein